jgi:hypothetical protein
MIVPEVQSPEFFSRKVEYLCDDVVPDSALDILKFVADQYGEPFVLGALAFNQAMERLDAAAGYELAPDQDQPILASEQVAYNDAMYDHRANLYAVWLAQRSQGYFQSRSAEVQAHIEGMLGSGTLSALLKVPLRYRIERVDNRLVIR